MAFWDKRSRDQATDATPRAGVDPGEPDAAERWVESGLELEAQARLEEALAHYQKAIQLQPELARAHFLRGNILLDRGDAAAALDAYGLAVRYKPDSSGAHCNLGNAHLQLADPLQATAAFTQALALKPGLPDAIAGLQAAQQLASEQAQAFFGQGLAAQEGGREDEAIRTYRQALTLNCEHVDALNNLAGILVRSGEKDEAVQLLLHAANLAPDSTAIFLNLGDALCLQRRWAEAVASYQRAGQLDPGNVQAPLRIGDALRAARKPDEAAAAYRQALQIDPLQLGAFLGLAAILIDGDELDAAQAHCLQVLALDPDNARANILRGLIYRKRQHGSDAMACFRKALATQPDLVEAHIHLGAAFQETGDFDAASVCYQKALALQPGSAAAHCGVGTLLQRSGQHVAAENSYRKALALDGELIAAHVNLGLLLTHKREYRKADDVFLRALELDPRFAAGHANRAGALIGLGDLNAALRSLERALEFDSTCMVAHNNLLFNQNYLAQQSGERLLADAKRFGAAALSLARPYTCWTNEPLPQRPLRVGLVSGDLGNHPVGYFLEGVLDVFSATPAHQLEFHAYSNRSDEDETSQRLRSCCTRWLPCVGMSDEALARRIHDDGIDVLIDLAGHTANNRLPLFAWKPAPVQLSWLGYFATTGLPTVDYFLADPWTLPPDQEAFFSEKVWRLPETRLCFTPPRTSIEVGPLPALTNGYLTFACFNNLSKMNDAVVQVWSRVLKAVPDSKLFLKYAQLDDESVRQRTLDRFAAHGVTAQRLILEAHSSRADYHSAHNRIDIALDPFPFPGGTTTVEALWMGVPVLTLQGETFLARQGVGLLMNAGLPDWVATDVDDYVDRAVQHASDLGGLAALRTRLRQQVLASPVYDAPRFARHFEDALRAMWINWCERAGVQVAPRQT
ncbi:MAG: tetratricopeptide repeat protein [Hylemonella sp.]|nr:tetratricopeptide repeat protein [Hylemonella sp.]